MFVVTLATTVSPLIFAITTLPDTLVETVSPLTLTPIPLGNEITSPETLTPTPERITTVSPDILATPPDVLTTLPLTVTTQDVI